MSGALHASRVPPAPAVGDRAQFETVIDEALIDRFADLSGDRNPLHVDEDYARRTPFGGRIAHGMIAGALFSRLVGEHLPGERALYRSQELRFLEPIPPGTRVTVSGEVTGIDSDLSLLSLRTAVTGPGGDPIYVEGTAEVVLREEEERGADAAPAAAPAAGRDLEGRRALVIGGSRGIGRAISLELGRRGADLAIGCRTDLDAARAICAEAAATRVRAVPVRLELASGESVAAAVRAAVEALGGLDVLVLSGHGPVARRGLERGEFADLLDAFQRSAGALHHAAKAALPWLKERGGSIVAVSSTVTLEPPPASWTAYTVAKSALVGLARSLAVELGPYGIRVNLVSPTLVEGEGTRAQPPRIREALAARSPLGRLARPEDVARAVAFLASDASSYLTGVNLPVDGGMTL